MLYITLLLTENELSQCLPLKEVRSK